MRMCVWQFCLNLQFLSIKLANFSYEIIIAGLSPCITAIWLGQDYRYPASHISHHSCPPFLYLTFCSTYLVQLQKAAKLLDSGAVRATRFLWRYPTARVILLFYLVRRVHVVLITKIMWKDLSCLLTMRNVLQVFVHLFLMHLLHRLQVQIFGHLCKCYEKYAFSHDRYLKSL